MGAIGSVQEVVEVTRLRPPPILVLGVGGFTPRGGGGDREEEEEPESKEEEEESERRGGENQRAKFERGEAAAAGGN